MRTTAALPQLLASLMLAGLLTATPSSLLAAPQVATSSSASAQLEPIVDEHGRQLYTIDLDEALVQQVDDSAEEPMRLASDPRNATEWRGWHRTKTRAMVKLLEREYGIEAVSMTSHLMSTFSAYLDEKTRARLQSDPRVTKLTLVISGQDVFSGPPSTGEALGYEHFPVTFDPPQPQAFEAFTVSFLAHATDGRPMSIQVEGNAIIIDFAGSNDHLGLAPPEGKVQATITGLPPGNYVVRIFQNHSPDLRNQHRLDHRVSEPDWALTVAEAPPATPAHAFYNLQNGHYFITGSAAERDGILRGEAGDGWILLREPFQAWPAAGPAPDAAKAVCRFYSASANSHFYAVEGAECEHLKREGSGWAYEGLAFRTLMATAGTCPVGTDPIWRLYNNRAAQNDSNHRFTTSATDYRSMIAGGWIGEGAVFCSPRLD